MNQIICDICGSEYPEGYDRCPVCSYPRQGGEKIVAAGAVEAVQEKVKGGHFSAKNVKKRRRAQKKAGYAAQIEEIEEIEEDEEPVPVQEEHRRNPNKPLWITIILLLLAIVLVTAYIAIRFGGGLGLLLPKQTTVPTTAAPTETTQPPTVPCAGVTLETPVIALDAAGQQHQIVLKLVPADTTDVPVFVSQDPAVVRVDETGLLTAVGSGQTTVTITCGRIVRECSVMCWFAGETTVPAETTAPTVPPETSKPTEATEPAVLKLDPEDVSCFSAGERFTIYARLGSSTVNRSKVTWSTSDAKVARVENGVVTAVGKGTATITAEYNGMKAVCTVRCRFENASEPDDGQQDSQQSADWKASHSDVSIAVGESFRLKVTNSAGDTAKAIWTMDKEGVVTVDGKTVTGKVPGTVTLTTTVDGVTMTCIVRVK